MPAHVTLNYKGDLLWRNVTGVQGEGGVERGRGEKGGGETLEWEVIAAMQNFQQKIINITL